MITVVIVTYKRHSEILSCLAALEKQTYPITEVIVVDNAPTSTEGSLKELISTLSFSFQIRYEIKKN
jgi:GT2 family glycosyltransferase